MSIDGLGEVWKFTPGGERSMVVDFDDPGALGLAVDAPGDVYVARGELYKGVWKVDREGNASLVPTVRPRAEATLADGLDFPASLALGSGKGERRSLFVKNYSLGPPIFAGPGLVKLPVEDPGMPLP